jgi:hypothetical protein
MRVLQGQALLFHVVPVRVLVAWLTWGMLKILEVDMPVLHGQLVTDFKLE